MFYGYRKLKVRHLEIVSHRKCTSCKIHNSGQDIHASNREIKCLESVYALNPVCLNPSSLHCLDRAINGVLLRCVAIHRCEL